MLANKNYIPLLKTGIAEIGAYRSLFPDVKGLIFPVFQARPWPNSNHMQLTVDRVREAVEEYPFGLALDGERHRHDNARPAQQEFDALFNDHRGFEAYYEFLNEIPGAVPVLIPTMSPDALLFQLGNADTLDRGLIIHQRREARIPLSDAILNLPPLPQDSIFILDAGWSRDYNALEAWALPMAERVSTALPNAEIVIMCSSFPSSFTHIVGNSEEAGHERRLFSVIRQRFNSADLTFGDWGSTRPPSGGGGGSIPSRVDLPKSSSWEIFRANPDNDLGFSEMAWDAQHHPCFGETPDCWGRQMITISDDTGAGITSKQISTQVRINIHLTVQSEASSVMPTDEIPYED